MVQRITRLPQIPDDGQWYHLLGYISECSLRDRLMLALAYHGALRRSEVTTITIEDIDPAHRLIRIRAENTKGKRERVVCYGFGDYAGTGSTSQEPESKRVLWWNTVPFVF